MSEDLVKRLRSIAASGKPAQAIFAESALVSAADLIEHQASLLAEAREALNIMGTAFAGYTENPMQDEALAILDATLAKLDAR